MLHNTKAPMMQPHYLLIRLSMSHYLQHANSLSSFIYFLQHYLKVIFSFVAILSETETAACHTANTIIVMVRHFNNEWTEKYAFIAVGANPLCLICNKYPPPICEEQNLRKHLKTAHANFDAKQTHTMQFCFAYVGALEYLF